MDSKKTAAKSAKCAFPEPKASIAIERGTLAAGKHLYRIHPSAYRGNEFNRTEKGSARFSPARNQTSADIIPTLYAGDSTEVAVCETLFHDVDVSQTHIVFDQRNLSEKHHTEIELQDDVVVAVLDQLSVVKMRAGKKLIHCEAAEYDLSRKWAECIHEQHQDIQGLQWPSRQHKGNAYVLFGGRVEESVLQIANTRALADDRNAKEKIIKLADRMNITID